MRNAAPEALAIRIIRALRARGHQAYLVGGCVRDRLLGYLPKDFDVSTDARPEEIARYFSQSHLVGTHFGVVRVHGTNEQGENGQPVEVATFRSESAYSDGRRPEEVHFETDPALDARRRDFTVNGLMEDPLSGQVIDHVGGKADLQTKTIRAIGDARDRFQEDYLRMLRAIRFAVRLGFAIEPATFSAIQEHAHYASQISAERVRDELVGILTSGNAREGLELLDRSGLLRYILPEVKALQGVEQPPEFHPEGDVWTHVMIMLEQMQQPSPTLAFGVLLHDVGKPSTFRIAERIRFDGHVDVGTAIAKRLLMRLRFSNGDIEQITALVANHMKFKDVRSMRLSTLKRFLRLTDFAEHLELHRLDCLASNGRTDSYDFVCDKLGQLSDEEMRPPRLVTGEDLLRIGYKTGRHLGEVLAAIETLQLEGEIATREEAVVRARTMLVPEN
ncbi:MAG TPA: CCA tRNA nucleotidyltransferase [Bryobacteraceae bacterium]|nr:CCA tRNA nucleotidyltransferase [Bryobacteraceae bacterium]HTF63702.1 CCA tRNA nucleotidyltransferase [Edaphobacter sp.]